MREPKPIHFSFLRPRGTHENLNLHSIDQLRRWAHGGISSVVVDPDTGQDVTRVPMV
jgi:hypothetical protein